MKQILIVDDELCRPANASMFRQQYGVPGVAFYFVGSENELFSFLEQTDQPACIFLDIRFEGNGEEFGLDLLKRLNDEGWPIPIIMMSSLSYSQTIIKAWDLGAQGYIVKWSDNEKFKEQFHEKVLKYAKRFKPGSDDLVERRKRIIRSRSQKVLQGRSGLGLSDLIEQARGFKESIYGEWINKPPFPASFQNYVAGWNETDEVLRIAEADHQLLYLNMDFGDGCSLRCPHCFTQEGAVDTRGRNPLPYERLKESIMEARGLGLRCVRILGRGEPTQWIHSLNKNDPAEGEDLLDFIGFLNNVGVRPLIFTRGQVIGDNDRIQRIYAGAHGVNTGQDLMRLLERLGVSLFVGVSSIFPDVNDEMVGIPISESYNYDDTCRTTLRLALQEGLNRSNPTRLAVEMPITNLNIIEMGVRYLLFQMLNISPCTNVYMVTGRAMTYGLGEITDPPQGEFLNAYAMVTRFARNMGIHSALGSYAGTKECHDVSCGMYLTLNGDLYPCPGYEEIHNMVGSLRTHSVKTIWENNPYGGHPQSICPPKIGTHFPPDFEDSVEKCIEQNQGEFDDLYAQIKEQLGR